MIKESKKLFIKLNLKIQILTNRILISQRANDRAMHGYQESREKGIEIK